MKTQIDFFKKDLLEAIGAGIYEIDICKNGKTEVLYIGESIFVLVRCASHLYNLKKNPHYFGFTKETIDDSGITLSFHLLGQADDTQKRKKLEKEIINSRKPLSQSGISDRQKNVEEKILALTSFLEDER